MLHKIAKTLCVCALVAVLAGGSVAAAPLGEYRLSKYDVINISIIGFDESGFKDFKDIVIGPDGFVNLPYAGMIKLAGLTLQEAEMVLKERLGGYFKIPAMSVMVKQYGPRKVYVMGEVNNQGVYLLNYDNMNIFAALSSAGGPTKRARTRTVAVVRVVDGKVEVFHTDLERFIKKHDITQNVELKDGDMVYVPRSNKIDLKEDIMPILNMYGLYKTITD